MAMKAGTVGLDPKYVDKNGAPITEGVDAYTKAQVDEKLAAKANISYLTANNKKFQFAYDSESGKYGYKAGATDDFHPFEEAGSEGLILNDLITTGITLGSADLEIVEGGYEEIDGVTYIDLTIKNNSESNVNASIDGLPHLSDYVYGMWFINGVNKAYIRINSLGSTGAQFIAGGATVRMIFIF